MVKLGKVRDVYDQQALLISYQLRLILACSRMFKNVFSAIESAPISEKSHFFFLIFFLIFRYHYIFMLKRTGFHNICRNKKSATVSGIYGDFGFEIFFENPP